MGSITNYTANNLNQYTALATVHPSAGTANPTHDNNGNLSFDGVFTYAYDTENRLTGISNGGTVATYQSDAQGRRKSKTVGAAVTTYITDGGNRVVLEYDGTTGAVQRWYAYGGGNVLNRLDVATSTRTTLIPDVQGSVIGRLDATTAALRTSGFLPFGGNRTDTASGFRYTAQQLDPETAGSTSQPSGLYYYRARSYSPAWGRFLQPDPIGYAGGRNMYSYVRNDPLNLVDPFGLETYKAVVTSDIFIGLGLGIEAGFYLNPGVEPGERFDVGITAAVQYGLGLDASIGGEMGFVTGPAENLSGKTFNANIGVPYMSGTATAVLDGPLFGSGPKLMGHGKSAAVELSAFPVSGSATFGLGGKLGTGDVMDLFNAAGDFFFGEPEKK